MTASYAEREIEVTFQLGKGSFGASGFDTVTVSGLRVTCHVQLAALPNTGPAQIRIYGLTLSQMNQLSQAGRLWKEQQDKVLVRAGDKQSGLTTIFKGQIYSAYPDFQEAPNTAFQIIAFSSGGEAQLKPVAPSSFEGATKLSTALGAIVKKVGLTLEMASGADVTLSNPYFPGAGLQQIQSALRAGNRFGYVDGTSNTLSVWPKDKGREGGATPTISPTNGMIGSPSFQDVRVTVRSQFDPSLVQTPGLKVNIESQLAAANGKFIVTTIDYVLSSQLPKGPWEMVLLTSPDK